MRVRSVSVRALLLLLLLRMMMMMMRRAVLMMTLVQVHLQQMQSAVHTSTATDAATALLGEVDQLRDEAVEGCPARRRGGGCRHRRRRGCGCGHQVVRHEQVRDLGASRGGRQCGAQGPSQHALAQVQGLRQRNGGRCVSFEFGKGVLVLIPVLVGVRPSGGGGVATTLDQAAQSLLHASHALTLPGHAQSQTVLGLLGLEPRQAGQGHSRRDAGGRERLLAAVNLRRRGRRLESAAAVAVTVGCSDLFM